MSLPPRQKGKLLFVKVFLTNVQNLKRQNNRLTIEFVKTSCILIRGN